MRRVHKQAALRLAFFAAFTLFFVIKAWVAEDAFITFRAVDNFLNGYGPVWNVGERVQAYTHPLWYALLVVGVGLFKNHYWVVIALSYACLIGTVWLLFRIGKACCATTAQITIALCALLLSHAFMDYSSSGLENPLLHLLLACYVLTAIRQQDAAKKFLHTSLLYSFIFLTRPDGIFIITPASLWMLWQAGKQSGWKRTLKLTALAASPALAWEAFSLIYYGSLVPNTALAKVNIDYPQIELFEHAKNYFIFNLRKDPLTLAMVALATLLAMLSTQTLPKLLMAGCVMHLLYICRVGGDYMVGRFLSAALLASVATFMQAKDIKWSQLAAWLLISPLTLLANRTDLYDYTISMIADERQFYYPVLGMLPVIMEHHWIAPCPWGEDDNFKPTTEPSITVAWHIGMGAWKNGSSDYIVDMYALTDPYLARLPARSHQRPGHYLRALPQGHIEFLATGESSVVEEGALAGLYSDIALTTRAPLWSRERWSAIWRLNTRHYNRKPPQFDRDDTSSWRALINADYVPNPMHEDGREYMGDTYNNFSISRVLAMKTLGVPMQRNKNVCSIHQESIDKAVCKSFTTLDVIEDDFKRSLD